MPVLVDTGLLLAYVRENDPLHDRAEALFRELWEGVHGTVLTVDHVLVEGLTYLRKTPGRREVTATFRDLLTGTSDAPPLLHLETTNDRLLRRAVTLHLELYDQGLSGVDAVILAHAMDLEATVATFDRGFRGLAPVVPKAS